MLGTTAVDPYSRDWIGTGIVIERRPTGAATGDAPAGEAASNRAGISTS
jgi:hypothetical protein